jgi:hypothetical protein
MHRYSRHGYGSVEFSELVIRPPKEMNEDATMVPLKLFLP